MWEKEEVGGGEVRWGKRWEEEAGGRLSEEGVHPEISTSLHLKRQVRAKLNIKRSHLNGDICTRLLNINSISSGNYNEVVFCGGVLE